MGQWQEWETKIRFGGKKFLVLGEVMSQVNGGSWFGDNVTQKIRNCSKMLFLHESWADGDVLKECFSRLFNLALVKNIQVRDMVLGRSIEEGCWSWRRKLFVWEIQGMEECRVLLFNIILQYNTEDTWILDLNSEVFFQLKKLMI